VTLRGASPQAFLGLKSRRHGRRPLLRIGSSFDIDLWTEKRLLHDDMADIGEADETKPHLHIRPLKVTPLPKHTVRSGLRILEEKDSLPTLPEVEYVLRTSETETREPVAAFSGYCAKFASGVVRG
jgi:hypothetical protein